MHKSQANKSRAQAHNILLCVMNTEIASATILAPRILRWLLISGKFVDPVTPTGSKIIMNTD